MLRVQGRKKLCRRSLRSAFFTSVRSFGRTAEEGGDTGREKRHFFLVRVSSVQTGRWFRRCQAWTALKSHSAPMDYQQDSMSSGVGGAMSASWHDDDDDLKVGGVKCLRSKPRFSVTEVKMLLEAVKRNRYIVLKKFNQGVSAEAKKQTWAEITDEINALGENHREVRQIMKKWADLKCDAKRRIVALRGPNGKNLRKKNLGPLEKMVHKILLMSPKGDEDSDVDLDDDSFSKLAGKGTPSNPSVFAYLGVTDDSLPLPENSYDFSPLSSPDKDPGAERFMDMDEDDDSSLSVPVVPPTPTSLEPLPDDALMRLKPVYTYSRTNSQNHNHIQNHTSSRPSTSLNFPPVSDVDAAPPLSPPGPCVPAPSLPLPSSDSAPQPPPAGSSSSATSARPDPSPSCDPSDPLPAGASSGRVHEQVSQLASQSLQQQRAGRMLLTSVSRSLEALAQSVQLLVESQHQFVQESLMLQRETVNVLKDFSNTALTMLRDKSNGGPTQPHTMARFNY
ncbi:neural Wiskott-Aldrich syndrome protein isoform X1 [Sphaeramia orbicularis]|uniref:Neural Wiskott-Aldrich syndrome protein-like n=2 Tax=Sphaeramia orbicularis TaxID=375764 RepID=A0A672Y5N6_9TELE|nr:neural Wiskott-Aldrich syndrome protein-like isoform X1 [Sphaeramia orbicularis]